ncbi:MAG: DUF6090 family protein [Calditrichaceae bacterium]
MKKINWSNYLIELFVVIFGVTIAFMLNSWYESNKSRELEKKYLQGFADDMTHDYAELDSIISSGETKISKVNRLLIILKHPPFDSDSVLTIFAEMAMFTPFDPNTTTYESIKSSGNLGVISDFYLRSALIRYYQTLNEKKYIDEIFSSYLNDFIIPFALKNIDFVENRFVSESVFRDYKFRNLTIGYIRLIDQNTQFYRRLYKVNSDVKVLLTKYLEDI